MPTVSASTTKTDVGYTASSLWTYSQGNDISYFVLLARYPAGSMAKLQVAKAYDAAIAGMTGGTSGLTLTAQSDISLNGHAGRSFLLTGKSGSIRGLIVLVGDNLYNAYVAFTPSADPASLDVFFANFKLTV